jgi:dTDP-4-dehydrorhamnose reductase
MKGIEERMRAQRILIFGSIGQVGWELRHKLACLGEIVSLDYPEVDFTKPETLRDAIAEHRPSVIVNAAAYTAVDKAESEPDLAMVINAAAPAVLADEARKLDALLVHYSTDYVFDGAGSAPRLETDIPAPLNVYGRTKLAGDQAIQSSGCDHLIFRTSWVYGARGKNFMLTMLRLGRERNELSIVGDQIGAPTTSECIAQATANVLAQVLCPRGKGIDGRSGIYNLTNEGETSWCEFARAIFALASKHFDFPEPEVISIPTSAYTCQARRPMNSRLCIDKLHKAFGVRLPNWEQGLALVFQTLAEGSAAYMHWDRSSKICCNR